MRLSGWLICADLAEVATIQRHLPDHLRLSRLEPGCLAFDVWQTADPLMWRVEEHFSSAAAFDEHQRRTRGSNWWAATAAIAREYAVDDG